MNYLEKRAKIIATLGPSSFSENTIKEMILKGVNVFRINCSHSSKEVIINSIKTVRKISSELNINIAILADLQGPKIRVNQVLDNVILKKGEEFILTIDNYIGDEKKVQVNYKEIAKEVKPKEIILLDDGKISLKVISTNGKNEIITKIIQGGELKSKKGLNLPDSKLSIPAITKKDIEDLETAVSEGVDWIALSFVSKASDIKELRKKISNLTNEKIGIISKIERPSALENIDKIIEVSDAIMIARGDLGIEIPLHKLPLIQKSIIKKTSQKGKPIIVATQMMESMINNITASRSDISDVSNAILDGADTLMLSGETSIGKNPIRVVEEMSRVIIDAELFLSKHSKNKPIHKGNYDNERLITSTLCSHSSFISKSNNNIKSISVITSSGFTALELSSMRPKCPILVFTENEKLVTLLSLVWGVKTFKFKSNGVIEDDIRFINSTIKKNNLISKGGMVINLYSLDLRKSKVVNTLRIKEIM